MNHLQTQLELVTQAASALGYRGVNPESLAAIRDSAEQWGWYDLAKRLGADAYTLHQSFDDVMAGFRALLAPL